MEKPTFIGISGGTGSGKTTIARSLSERLGEDRTLLIPQDSYYKDRSDMPLSERGKINYDHPRAFDMDLMISQLTELLKGSAVELPIYDYKLHVRKGRGRLVCPKEVIILEGILVFVEPILKEMMDLKVFVALPDDVRFIRRLLRDMRERARTPESVVEQYMDTVRPMHVKFVAPSKAFADIVVRGDAAIEDAVSAIINALETKGLNLRKTSESHGI